MEEYCMNQNCMIMMCKKNPKRIKDLKGKVFKFYENTWHCRKGKK